MRAADFHPMPPSGSAPTPSQPRWQAIALAYRLLASGQRLVLEHRANAGETLVRSALEQLAKLGIEKVFVQDQDPSGSWLAAGERASTADKLAALEESIETHSEEAPKDDRSETLELLRTLSELLARGDQLVHGMLEILHDEDS